jgi:hypothetical protein
MSAILELTGSDSKSLGASRVSIQIAEAADSPALLTIDAEPLPRAAGLRSFVGTLKLGVLPPGEYVARAIVKIPGNPDTHITRSFRLAPVAAAADSSPIAARVSADEAPAPLSMSRIVAPVTRFAIDDVLKPEVVGGFLDALQRNHPVSRATAAVVQQARQGTFVMTPADGKAPAGDEPMLAFIRGLAQLRQKQYAQAAAWFQLTLKSASDFLGAAFYLGAVHAAAGRDADAIGAWQMSLIAEGSKPAYPMLVDALLRNGDGQGALDLIAEAPDAWPTADARLRRVATAQAMLGQFEPALDTLAGLLDRQSSDVDLLFVAIQVLYRQHLARPLTPEHRARFDDYSKTYLAAAGAESALVAAWRRYVLR